MHSGDAGFKSGRKQNMLSRCCLVFFHFRCWTLHPHPYNEEYLFIHCVLVMAVDSTLLHVHNLHRSKLHMNDHGEHGSMSSEHLSLELGHFIKVNWTNDYQNKAYLNRGVLNNYYIEQNYFDHWFIQQINIEQWVNRTNDLFT